MIIPQHCGEKLYKFTLKWNLPSLIFELFHLSAVLCTHLHQVELLQISADLLST